MRICFGWSRIPLNLSPERRYFPEELLRMLTPSSPPSDDPLVSLPLWIHLDGVYIRLRGEEQISLACQLICVYHDGPDCRAPSDDGWTQDTLDSEERAMNHMLSESSEEDEDEAKVV
jgi:hypothetical protein